MDRSSQLHSHAITGFGQHDASEQLSAAEHHTFESFQKGVSRLPRYVQTFLLSCSAHMVQFHIHASDHIIISRKQVAALNVSAQKNITDSIADIREHYGIRFSILDTIPEQSPTLIERIRDLLADII